MLTENMKQALDQVAELITSDRNFQHPDLSEDIPLLVKTLTSYGFKDVVYQDTECSSSGEYVSMTFTGKFDNKDLIIEISSNHHYDIFTKFFDLQDTLDAQPEIPLSHKLQVIMLKSLVEFL